MSAADTIQAIFGRLNLAVLPFNIPVGLWTMPLLLSFIITNWVAYDNNQDKLTNPELSLACRAVGLLQGNICGACVETFDFVVIGGGSAGMVVATRLGNNTRNHSVLLLEAGGEPAIVNNMPILDASLMNKPENTWRYNPPPQINASLGCYNSSPATVRGKMLGGSSSLNFMMYVRGNSEDYNGWATTLNDSQWNYTNVLEYFKKSEDYKGYQQFDPTYHGTGGLLGVGATDFIPGADQFLAAAQERGYQIGDYNGASQAVFSPIDLTTRKGWRSNTYKAFYQDTTPPPNLKIKKYSLVTKISFNGTRAISVTYERQGCTRTVFARKEIILSAGVFNSPQILMLSGIGPRNDLTQLNIPVVADLPVGQTMQDHVFTIVGPFVKSPVLNIDEAMSVENAYNYFANGTGAFSSSAGITAQGFIKSPSAAYPNMQILQAGFNLNGNISSIFYDGFGINSTFFNEWTKDLSNQDVRLPFLILGRPKSSGILKLASTDPHDLPIQNPKYYTDPNGEDVETLLWGYKEVLAMYENTTALNVSLVSTPMPGCEKYEFRSDDYFRCCIRTISISLFHHCGTNPMGRVVDSNLRVIGITGLRVIDASVIPSIPNGNTNAPTIMIGEKGADMILKQYSAQ